MAEVICFGDLLIDFVALQSGVSLAEVESFQKAPGGAPANVAVGLARLGRKSGFMGKVGEDAFGHFLAKTLEGEGVDVSPLRFDKGARTTLAFVSLGADGDREFMFYRHPGADMLFRSDEVDQDAIKAARIFHFDSISQASPLPRETAFFAAKLAADAGLLISYDVNLRLPLWGSDEEAKKVIKQGLGHAHIAKLSDDELEFFTGKRDPQAARDMLWHPGLSVLVITRGGAGCTVLTADDQFEVKSIKVEPIDTTGAGDGFVAGMLDGLLGQPDLTDIGKAALSQICHKANVVGALTTLRRGAIPALPSRDDVQARL